MVRQEKIPQPGGAGFGLKLFDNRDRLPAVSFGDLLIVELLVRVDVLVHERGELPLQFLDLRRMREVHPRIVTQCGCGCKGAGLP